MATIDCDNASFVVRLVVMGYQTPFLRVQLIWVSETGFGPVSTRFVFKCTLFVCLKMMYSNLKEENGRSDQVVVVILCFTLVWFWRRYTQWHNAARARDAAARRRIATVCQLQEDELALVTMIMAQQLVLIRVRQRRSL